MLLLLLHIFDDCHNKKLKLRVCSIFIRHSNSRLGETKFFLEKIMSFKVFPLINNHFAITIIPFYFLLWIKMQIPKSSSRTFLLSTT